MPQSKRKVVLASRNPDKVRELRQLFVDTPFEAVSAEDYPGLPDVIEDGTTLAGNARRKAVITAAHTGEIAVADDTGLEVRELNGLPDIFAARFSGPDATYDSNAQLVLDLMQDVPDEHRQARFSTGCVWVDPRPAAGLGAVMAPAKSRWLRNPWLYDAGVVDMDADWSYWNSLADRRHVWAAFRRQMETDLSSWGHSKDRLREIADGLFRTCEDALRPGETLDDRGAETGMRLPDTSIWALRDRGDAQAPLTRVAPGGLDRAAPGRELNDPVWLEIRTTGRLLGEITRQPIGSRGFGYDPVFRPEGEQRTLAEMPAAEKNAISHRGRAMRRLMRAVTAAYGG